jgi:hypothetical protein
MNATAGVVILFGGAVFGISVYVVVRIYHRWREDRFLMACGIEPLRGVYAGKRYSASKQQPPLDPT